MVSGGSRDHFREFRAYRMDELLEGASSEIGERRGEYIHKMLLKVSWDNDS